MLSIHQTMIAVFLFPLVFVVFLSRRESMLHDPAPYTLSEWDEAINKILNDSKAQAAGIAMVQGDSMVWVAGLGMADKEKGIEASENTMFRIGSTSKMFVSLAILKLQEEGRVSLLDTVKVLIPEIEFK